MFLIGTNSGAVLPAAYTLFAFGAQNGYGKAFYVVGECAVVVVLQFNLRNDADVCHLVYQTREEFVQFAGGVQFNLSFQRLADELFGTGLFQTTSRMAWMRSQRETNSASTKSVTTSGMSLYTAASAL